MGWMCQQTSRGQMLIYLVKLTSKVRKRDLVLKCLLSMDPSFMDPKAKLKVMWMWKCRKVIYMVMGKLIWTVVLMLKDLTSRLILMDQILMFVLRWKDQMFRGICTWMARKRGLDLE